MQEQFSGSRAEDAIDKANTFLWTERNAQLDGSFAAQQVEQQILSVEAGANNALTQRPIAGRDGYFAPLSAANANEFGYISTILKGYVVLVPGKVGTESFFRPAVISEKSDHVAIRLTILEQPYRGSIIGGTANVLSAAGQFETKGVGNHGRLQDDSLEVEHFSALLAAGKDLSVQNAWRSGTHTSHTWSGAKNTSVSAEVSNRLFNGTAPQTTLEITQSDVQSGRTMLLWHDGLRDEDGYPETATRPNALLVYQALGFTSLRPQEQDTLKGLIA